MRSKLLLPVPNGGVGLFILTVGLFAQNESSAEHVEVSSVKLAVSTLHLDQANGPHCGKATVQVVAAGIGEPGISNPKVTVELVEYSSDPPGATVEITKDGVRSGGTARAEAELTLSPGSFEFEVCATGTKAGSVVVQGAIIDVTPSSKWTVKGSEPENSRTKFGVAE
jgi:hypothetical protein